MLHVISLIKFLTLNGILLHNPQATQTGSGVSHEMLQPVRHIAPVTRT